MSDRPTSASSPGSEDSTSPSRRSGTSASAKSSGTPPAPEPSSDGGRLFPDGETSTSSPLLPSPTANQYEQDPEVLLSRRAREAAKGRNGNGFGLTTAQAISLLPTPSAALGEGGMTSRSGGRKDEPLLGNIGGLISYAEGSPASPPAMPAGARGPRTTAGSGPSSPVWLASWDPDTSSWRTSQVSLLSIEDERFPRSSERWPSSGMTRRGEAFALPTWVRPTGGSGSSSSLNVPTPTASDAIWGDKEYERRGKDGRNHNLGLVEWAKMLPTPDATHGRKDSRTSDLLPGAVEKMLPTPMSGPDSEASHGQVSGRFRSKMAEAIGSNGEPTPPRSDDGNG